MERCGPRQDEARVNSSRSSGHASLGNWKGSDASRVGNGNPTAIRFGARPPVRWLRSLRVAYPSASVRLCTKISLSRRPSLKRAMGTSTRGEPSGAVTRTRMLRAGLSSGASAVFVSPSCGPLVFRSPRVRAVPLSSLSVSGSDPVFKVAEDTGSDGAGIGSLGSVSRIHNRSPAAHRTIKAGRRRCTGMASVYGA